LDTTKLAVLAIYAGAAYLSVLVFLHVLGQFFNFHFKALRVADEIRAIFSAYKDSVEQKIQQVKDERESEARALAEGLKKLKQGPAEQ